MSIRSYEAFRRDGEEAGFSYLGVKCADFTSGALDGDDHMYIVFQKPVEEFTEMPQ